MTIDERYIESLRCLKNALELIKLKTERITELEAIANEIIKIHRDVETGLEVPKYIYKMAAAAMDKGEK